MQLTHISSALKAGEFRIPAILRHSAAAYPSLVKVCRIAVTNVWSCFDNAEGLKVPRHLKYEKYNEKEISRASFSELLCSEVEDAAIFDDSLDYDFMWYQPDKCTQFLGITCSSHASSEDTFSMSLSLS